MRAHSPGPWLAVAATLCVLWGTLASALTITNSDIVGNKYSYDLNRTETLNGTFWNDISFATPGCFVTEDAWGATYVRGETGYMTGYFEYRFDFSESDYRPVHLNLTDNIALFRNNKPTENDVITTALSFDGVNFQTVQSHTTSEFVEPGMGWVSHTDWDIPGLPDVVYYRVTFTNLDGLGFGWLQTQWNRLDSTDPPGNADLWFNAKFDVENVPEPGTIMLLGMGAAGLFLRRRVRR